MATVIRAGDQRRWHRCLRDGRIELAVTWIGGGQAATEAGDGTPR